ncbi:hypothetical protein PISMIDRAFT_117447 [Pisolithus microcarpus 441]|uniref:DUF6830 domain-containing protein n=1 Tax=Pisolithus microcarpus 441 TaxID=765257 RepID=A0A0C9YK22_9AGAM|nr:hypothetical protein BKA83DRAFT_117447 [Pisolithus microcarpus]KIK14189.1 hypothetical protein PISMIDRAFT_117447 [Pisolithus microcarpus 441]
MDPPRSHPLPPALHSTQDSGDWNAQYHAKSGWVYGRSKNTLEHIQDDWYERNRETNIHWPFQSRAEWRLGKFLAENLTQAQINAFLKLDWLDSQKPSFSSAHQLLDWMDALPSGPRWQVMELEVDGYNMEKKIKLIYRDGLEVIESLFGNPIFAQNMLFDPLHVWRNAECEYGEWFTAREAIRIQDTLPEGATLVPIITASDKMPVTRHTGSLEMHPLFLMIGNIDSDAHMKATVYAWHCVAFMPTIKFDVHPDYQTILQARLWHRCVDIVTEKLKCAANVGEFMTDPFGDVRHCFTPLVAWTADFPEQQLIASVGDVEPWMLDRFQKIVKANQLLGIHLLFFRNWKNSDPSCFLVPEVLHSLHKFFWDHVLKWCKEVVGTDELDARYKVHHKCVGVCHFNSGISHATQMTGREYRNIQCTIVAMIAGAAPPAMVRSIRALIDFIYLAQRHVHTESSIGDMEASLAEFHVTKHNILDAGGRAGKDNFNIPKLELMLSFADAIRRSGGLIQYSANVSERLLITHCKVPFTWTNRQSDFAEQIVRLLDREECIHLLDVYLLLCEHDEPLVNAAEDEENLLCSADPTSTWISCVVPGEQHHFKAPRSICNLFTKGLMSNGATAALSVTVTPNRSKLKIADISNLYALPNFATGLNEYVARHAESTTSSEKNVEGEWGDPTPWVFDEIAVWYKFRIQQYSTCRPSMIMPSQVVQAQPPSSDLPFGNCDAVLLNVDGQSQDNPVHVAEVRAVFQLVCSHHSRDLPNFLSQPLLYVRPFHVIATPDSQLDTHLWILKRVYSPSSPQAPACRIGFILPLTEVTHAVDLVPVFGEKVDRTLTMVSSQERYDRFYLNSYVTKEDFDTLYTLGQM